MIWTGAVFVRTNESDFAVAQQYPNAIAADVNDFAESVYGAKELVYLNYDSTRQYSLVPSYGVENLRLMHKVGS
ncbi:hypothetical protein CTRI78_v010572 [Colletotrichum trifolii]|uniref:Uncharacterized protein n=1 Tax=Colletotrichum trifolii TaxID=5466 RepID=A0A4R8QKI9_COLTR|nr:hypothetical protein CTRI78_v010572 [Colletotrichum trifolii]